MNTLKMLVATVLALLYLIPSILLACLILLLFAVLALPMYYLVKKVSPASKTYKVCVTIIKPFADCFELLMERSLH